MMPESIRVGSPLFPAAQPQYLVGIYGITGRGAGARKTLIATGFAYKHWICTAQHAVCDSTFSKILVEYQGTFLDPGEWFHAGPDLSVCVNKPIWSIPACKIDTVDAPTHSQIVASCAGNNSSMGLLKHVPKIAMGFVEYTGSTLPGFSGAPYMNGQKVLGMHLGGGTTGNYGYSASYIDMCLKRMNRPESSELAFIRRVLKSTRKSDFEYERHLDETCVRVGGRYMVLDNADFDQLVDEEEFMDYFFDIEEDEVTSKPKRKFKRRRGFEVYEEPAYVPESDGKKVEVVEDEETDAFLGQKPPRDSFSADLAKVTELVATNTQTIQSMQDLLERTIVGQQELTAKYENLCMYVQNNVLESLKTSLNQLEMNMNTRLEQHCARTKSDLELPCSPARKVLPGILVPVSGNSTQNPQQDSESSANTQQSVMLWDGMDLDLQKFREWRNSVDPSKPEYSRLREGYFTAQGLSLEKRLALVATLSNRLKAERRKKKKGAIPTPTQ